MRTNERGWELVSWEALNERFRSRAWDFALAGLDPVARDEETGEAWQMMNCHSRPTWMGDFATTGRHIQYRVEFRHRCLNGAREYRKLTFDSDPATGHWYHIRVEVIRRVSVLLVERGGGLGQGAGELIGAWTTDRHDVVWRDGDLITAKSGE